MSEFGIEPKLKRLERSVMPLYHSPLKYINLLVYLKGDCPQCVLCHLETDMAYAESAIFSELQLGCCALSEYFIFLTRLSNSKGI